MIRKICGAILPLVLLGASWSSKGLFQSTIRNDLELESDNIGSLAPDSEKRSFASFGPVQTRLKFSIDDFNPQSIEKKSDRVADIVESLRAEVGTKAVENVSERLNHSEIDSIFDAPKSALQETASSNPVERNVDFSSSDLLLTSSRSYSTKRFPSLIRQDYTRGPSSFRNPESIPGQSVLPPTSNGQKKRTEEIGRGAGSGLSRFGSRDTGSGGGGGGIGSISLGGGGNGSVPGVGTVGGQSPNPNQNSVLSNVDRFLMNGVGDGQALPNPGKSSSSLLASSSRPQLTADGKFGIPNHQYWTFDFKDVTGPNGTPDGIVDKRDADRNFNSYLAGLQPQLDAAKQVVKWNPTELKGIYDDLNTQIPTSGPPKSPSYLTFMIIDFPVKGFYLPKSEIPSNPGLPPGGLE